MSMANKVHSSRTDCIKSYDMMTNCVPHDLEITSQDGIMFKAHKMILCQVSQYFVHLFQSDPEPSQKGIFRLKLSYSQHVIRQILFFAYENVCQIDKETLITMLQVSDEFNIKTLTKQCEDFLWNRLNQQNCAQYKLTADTYCLGNMKAVNGYLNHNIKNQHEN